MNNKGLGGFNLMLFVFVMVLVVMVLSMAQNHVDTSTINNAIDSLDWNKIGQNITAKIDIIKEGKSVYIQVIFSIVYKAIDFIGYSIVAISKLAMMVARDNPDIINFKVLLVLIGLMLIAPLIIKEWYINRKERKQLNKLRDGK